MMLKRILLAVDRSDMAERAVTEAIALAKAQGAVLRLIHVLVDGESGSPPKLLYNDRQYLFPSGLVLEQYQQEWNRFVDEWWKFLRWRVEEIELEGLKASCDVLQGRPGRQICQAAKDWDADLIVMGCRGLSAARELFLGSVSHYVTHRAPCSVFVVQPNRLAWEALQAVEGRSLSEVAC